MIRDLCRSVRRFVFGTPSADAARLGEECARAFTQGIAEAEAEAAARGRPLTFKEIVERHGNTIETARRIRDFYFPDEDGEEPSR